MTLSRRDALWATKGLTGTHGAEVLPLFKASAQPLSGVDEESGLPPMRPGILQVDIGGLP